MRAGLSTAVAGIALAVLFTAAGCATTLEAAPSPRPGSDLQAQLFKLQKDTARILALLDRREGDATSEATAACAEIAARLEEIERRMGTLEEQLLATQSRVDDAVTEVRTLRRTLPWSLAAGRGAPSGFPATGSGTAESPGTASAPAGGPGPAAGTASAGAAGTAPPAASPEDQFNAAYADFSRGNYDLALAGFEQALRADPNGPLAPTCQFFIGETLMAMNRYDDAVAAFDQLISAWPDSQRVRTARLKRGIALFESHRTVEAVQALQDLINEAPDSDEAKIAEEYLRRKGIRPN